MRGLILIGAAALMLPTLAQAQQRIAPETWITAADYPPISGDGIIALDYAVTPEGRVAACSVRYATVQKEIAETACPRLMERARYVPASDTSGKPVSGRDTIVISWVEGVLRIPGTSDYGGAVPANNPQLWATDDDYPRGMPKSKQLDVPMTLIIGSDGRIASCLTPLDFSHPAIAAHTCRLMVRRARFQMPLDTQGKPLPTQGRTVVHWRGIAK
ncbi:MAG: hypothetical protein EOP62_14470 [Sphingomonadales bacterium]|nr:MAG: hypothetical protein EOP62_14470 [Sphingomonadales bacterium]